MLDPSERNPGEAWSEILARPTLAAFALAFAPAPRLEARVLETPIVGVGAIRDVFQTTRRMFHQIRFTDEARAAAQIRLEWEGRFCGLDMSGVTLLHHDASGAIDRIRLHHGPRGAFVAFAAELQRRLRPALAPPAAIAGHRDAVTDFDTPRLSATPPG